MALCLCLSLRNRCFVETDGRINLGFGMVASFDQSYTVFYGNSGIYKNKGRLLPSETFLNYVL